MKTGPVFRHKIALNKTGRKRSRDIFSNTIQKTDVWLNDLMSDLDWEDRPHKTYMALRTVLHALRDRLPVEEAVQLGASCRCSFGASITKAGTSKTSRTKSDAKKIVWITSKKLSKMLSRSTHNEFARVFSRC